MHGEYRKTSESGTPRSNRGTQGLCPLWYFFFCCCGGCGCFCCRAEGLSIEMDQTTGSFAGPSQLWVPRRVLARIQVTIWSALPERMHGPGPNPCAGMVREKPTWMTMTSSDSDQRSGFHMLSLTHSTVAMMPGAGWALFFCLDQGGPPE